MPGPFRTLKDPAVLAARRQMLICPHMADLTAYVQSLRAMGRGEVPDFDPLDGGIRARILFLFEKPGPMTSSDTPGARVGSGFISRDNDDPTAEATSRFMNLAGLARELTITWNVIPWWNGTRRIIPEELRAGREAFEDLIDLLPNLAVAVLVGGKAGRMQDLVERRGLRAVRSAHPSPIVRASRPSLWTAIPDRWAEAESCRERMINGS